MPVLEARGICKRYASVTALEDVSLSLGEREVLGLVGPNGAGKSTLIDIVSGFTDADSGSVSFRGRDVTRRGAHLRVRDGLGRTFQIVQTFEGLTAVESVMVAAFVRHRKIADARSAAEASLARVGLDAERDTPIENLSLAQQRLLELARVLTLKPAAVLLDEPMSGLTLEERERAMGSVRQLVAGGVSVLLVEHDMTVIADLCDRVEVLDYGRTIASGTPEEIAEDPAVIEAYLGRRHAAESPEAA